jgi:hypothetical protein
MGVDEHPEHEHHPEGGGGADLGSGFVAEAEGFEPTVALPGYRGSTS